MSATPPELDLCVREDCYNYNYIPSDCDVEMNPCPKIYVSMDVLCSQCSALDINPTFILQVYCLNIHDCSTQSWQMLKTFKRFIEIDHLLRNEFPDEMKTVMHPLFPKQSKPVRCNSRKRFFSHISPRNKTARASETLSVAQTTEIREKMLHTVQKYIDEVMLAEILMFSPTLCRFFAITENLGRVRLFTGNQLQKEIQSNTELQLRKAIYFHERQLENERNATNAFLNSSEFCNEETSLQRLKALKESMEETSILLDACKLNLEVWLDAQDSNPNKSEKQERNVEDRQASLVLQLEESSSEIRSDQLFSPLHSSGERQKTFLNTGILAGSLRLQAPGMLRRSTGSSFSINDDGSDNDMEQEKAPEEFLKDSQELEDFLNRLEAAMSSDNMFLVNRFIKAVEKRMMRMEEIENVELMQSEGYIALATRAREMIQHIKESRPMTM